MRIELIRFLRTQLTEKEDDFFGGTFIDTKAAGPFKPGKSKHSTTLRDEASVGESRRFAMVFVDIVDTCTALHLTVTTHWDLDENMT